MSEITTIGLDIAKNVFHAVCCDARGKVVSRKKLRRGQVLAWFAQRPRCRVGIEACGASHHWARELGKLGHDARLLAPKHVKPYRRGNKNDYNDALAIAEAVVRPEMRTVAVKSMAAQDLQTLNRLRAGAVSERTAVANRLRGLLAEYGRVLPKGIDVLRRRLPELLEEAENGLSDTLRRLLAEEYRHLLELDERVAFYTRELMRLGQADEGCRRLQTIPGFGPIVASVFRSRVEDGSAYRRGREVAASLGLVPKQHSSGGKTVLLRISRQGDRYLRSLLIHGARAVVARAADKEDRLSRWINEVRARRGTNKAVVALANKMARMGWAILAHDTVYQPA